MAFEQQSGKVAAQERKKEFFDAAGHFTDYAIEGWVYGKLSYDTSHSEHIQAKAHEIVCRKCKLKIQARRNRDSQGRSRSLPVGDRD